ncbi:MAG: hypothetical protein WKF77_19780 [Planctomycetaceae bacterium]
MSLEQMDGAVRKAKPSEGDAKWFPRWLERYALSSNSPDLSPIRTKQEEISEREKEHRASPEATERSPLLSQDNLNEHDDKMLIGRIDQSLNHAQFSRFGRFEKSFYPKSEEPALGSRKIDDDRHNGASNHWRMP